MFGTILGGLPPPPEANHAMAAVEAAIGAQEAAGLEPLTDGRFGWQGTTGDPDSVASWRAAAAFTDRAVKQTLPGPYSLAWRVARGTPLRARAAAAQTRARELRAQIVELAQAGCPLIEIEEDEAHRIGDDAAERATFRDAHLALTDGLVGTHLSLSIVGGSADAAGIETILAPAYSSLAVDLIAGPDNWRLVTAAPPTVGIVVGAMSAAADGDEGPEMVLWAARYAATGGRGTDRVGVALVPGLERLAWDAAVRKLERLGRAARVAALPAGEELAASVDPRAIDARTAALGRRRK